MPTTLISAQHVMYSSQSHGTQEISEAGIKIKTSLGQGDFGILYILSSAIIFLKIGLIFFDFHQL